LSLSPSPLRSLWGGHWFKLICGASYQHLPAIEHLTRVYALAGADCIDLAADPAVIAVARQTLDTLSEWGDRLGIVVDRPWLMVSVNDGEDPHFRKAVFDPQQCPSDCPRPCVNSCPTQAIVFEAIGLEENPDLLKTEVFKTGVFKTGVQSDRCYGCGRCLPVCPLQYIHTQSYVVPAAALMPQLMDDRGIDALELHTQVGHESVFKTLWETIESGLPHLKLLAISCPFAPDVLDYLHWIAELIDPLPCVLLWQTDGRPMSGDIGSGTTHTAIRFAQELLRTDLPGFVQLAGGTNAYTVPKLLSLGLLSRSSLSSSPDLGRKVSGVAYGSYARKLLEAALERCPGSDRVEDYTAWLRETVGEAQALVGPLKQGSGQEIGLGI
jgi:Fe-S-cluster-containing hydrogenase component 2